MTKEEFATLWVMYYRASLLSLDDFRDEQQKMLDFLKKQSAWAILDEQDD